MKETYYFAHDYNATQDPKMMMLLARCGLQGVGAYWVIIELLHQQPDSKLSLEAFRNYLAFYVPEDLTGGTDVQQVLNKIEQVLISTKLFIIDDDFVFSNRVLENKKQRQLISEKRSMAGKKSAEVRQKATSVEQVLNKTQHKKGKERKGKEKKVNNIATVEQAIAKSPEAPGVKKIFEIFYQVNPTLNFGNTTYRKAAEEMIKKFGEETVVNAAQKAIECFGKKYAPTISNPFLLKSRLPDLMAYYKKEQGNITPTL